MRQRCPCGRRNQWRKWTQCGEGGVEEYLNVIASERSERGNLMIEGYSDATGFALAMTSEKILLVSTPALAAQVQVYALGDYSTNVVSLVPPRWASKVNTSSKVDWTVSTD
jgi:hypothetical protein